MRYERHEFPLFVQGLGAKVRALRPGVFQSTLLSNLPSTEVMSSFLIEGTTEYSLLSLLSSSELG